MYPAGYNQFKRTGSFKKCKFAGRFGISERNVDRISDNVASSLKYVRKFTEVSIYQSAVLKMLQRRRQQKSRKPQMARRTSGSDVHILL
jgi:hypothetical protein